MHDTSERFSVIHYKYYRQSGGIIEAELISDRLGRAMSTLGFTDSHLLREDECGKSMEVRTCLPAESLFAAL